MEEGYAAVLSYQELEKMKLVKELRLMDLVMDSER